MFVGTNELVVLGSFHHENLRFPQNLVSEFEIIVVFEVSDGTLRTPFDPPAAFSGPGSAKKRKLRFELGYLYYYYFLNLFHQKMHPRVNIPVTASFRYWITFENQDR